MMLDTSPVAAKERFRAEKVQSPRDIAPIAFREDQRHVIGQGLVRDVKETPGQVGRAPFARAVSW